MIQLDDITFGGLDVRTPLRSLYGETDDALIDILSKNQDIRDASDAKSYLDSVDDDCKMQPLHNSAEDLVIIDENYCAMMWVDQSDPNNSDLMIAIIFMADRSGGQTKFKPTGVVVGDEFEGVLQFRSTCCRGDNTQDQKSAYSMLIFMEQDGHIVSKTLDTNVTKTGCIKKFERLTDGVNVSSHDLGHYYRHYLNPHAECGHDHSQMPKLKHR
jgi:hypothetical protein